MSEEKNELVHWVCPHCDAVNRVPRERLNETPNCGACHLHLLGEGPLQLTGRNFDTHVGRSDIPLLVDFWAPWCGPCQAMAPAFEQAALELEPQVRLGKLNTDEEQTLAARLGIRSIPTLILFHAGREVARHSGAMSKGDILRWLAAQRAV